MPAKNLSENTAITCKRNNVFQFVHVQIAEDEIESLYIFISSAATFKLDGNYLVVIQFNKKNYIHCDPVSAAANL